MEIPVRSNFNENTYFISLIEKKLFFLNSLVKGQRRVTRGSFSWSEKDRGESKEDLYLVGKGQRKVTRGSLPGQKKMKVMPFFFFSFLSWTKSKTGQVQR